MPSFKSQAVTSVKWAAFKTAIVAVTGLLLTIVKANFLTPYEFGYLAIIMVFIGLFSTLEKFGINQAVIQKEFIHSKEASSLFFFNIFFSGFLAITLFLLSNYISSFFSFAELDYYLEISVLIVLVGGPAHLFRAFMEKHLLFKQLSIIEIAKHLIQLVFILAFLLMGWGLLGVIYGYLISFTINTLAIVAVSFQKKLVAISLHFNYKDLIPFLRFGLFVSGKEMNTYIASRLDEVIIGYFLSSDVLGVYYFAKHLLKVLQNVITSSFAKILFPLFSKLKNDKEKINRAYKKITSYMALISFPLFAGVSLTAQSFVPVIFGEQWLASIPVFQVLSLVLIVKILSGNISNSILYALNKPEIVFYIDLFANIVYFISLILFASQGLEMVLLLYVLYTLYRTLPQIYYANAALSNTFQQYIRCVLPALLLTMAMAAGVLLFQEFLTNRAGDLVLLILSISIGVLIYTVLGYIFQKKTAVELYQTFKSRK